MCCAFSLHNDAVSQCIIEETKLRESFEENTARLSRTSEIKSWYSELDDQNVEKVKGHKKLTMNLSGN